MHGDYFVTAFLLLLGLSLLIAGISSRLEFIAFKIMETPDPGGRFQKTQASLIRLRRLLWILILVLLAGFTGVYFLGQERQAGSVQQKRNSLTPVFDPGKIWQAPDEYLAETDRDAELIRYGRDLIVHTQDYFGENGLVNPGSINGMNCQNCHLEAGTRAFGNNYFAVQSTYPQYRARLGALETVAERVNDCFERSLNGAELDTTGREMRAILAYLRWLGSGVPKGAKPKGQGLVELPFLSRPADPAAGEAVFRSKCASCHGGDGQGMPMPGSQRFYPPLWGDKSYSESAGLFRLSRFAAFVKANMPFGATYQYPQLTDEEAWNVAAFVNSRPRPKHRFLDKDWPQIAQKPFDHPFGPYNDSFPAPQHKYGPFEPIVAFHKKK